MEQVLEKVHKVQLEMALEVKRICEKHDIRYFIIGGTLLGAVRHQGFIPWDDDLDIGMLRPDFERFVAISHDELDSNYFMQTWDTDLGFGLPIAKLRKSGTKFIENNSSKSNLHNGIYIDIFPFDNVPEKLRQRKIQNFRSYVLKRMILTKLCYELWNENQTLKKMIYRALSFVTKPIPVKMLKNRLCRIMTACNNVTSKNIVTFGGAYGYWKETIKRTWVEDLTLIAFEGYEFSCPRQYAIYLEHLYGDYMTPPPEDKRYNRHQVIHIEFGDEIDEKSNNLRNI